MTGTELKSYSIIIACLLLFLISVRTYSKTFQANIKAQISLLSPTPPHAPTLWKHVPPPHTCGSEPNQTTKKNSLQRQGTYNAFAADVWAAGVCLWVFRFGTPPFYNPDPSNLFLEICSQPLLFPFAVDEGDEEVIRQETKEARRQARRAKVCVCGGGGGRGVGRRCCGAGWCGSCDQDGTHAGSFVFPPEFF